MRRFRRGRRRVVRRGRRRYSMVGRRRRVRPMRIGFRLA